MASFTSFLNLLKKNPATDGKDTFNIETMLNENWDKIDLKVEENSSAIGQLQDDIGNIDVSWPAITGKPTTVSGYGITDAYTESEIDAQMATKMDKSGGTFTGVVTAQNNTSYGIKQVRNITLSTADPSGGANGDIWIKYV